MKAIASSAVIDDPFSASTTARSTNSTNSSDTSPRQIAHGWSSQPSSQISSRAFSMIHPLDLNDEAPDTIDQSGVPTTIRAITARLRDRPGAVSKASDDGSQKGPIEFPSPAPVAASNGSDFCR